MTRFIFLICFMSFSFFGISQENSYSIDFKKNIDNLGVSKNTSVLIFEEKNTGYTLVSGEEIGLPKVSDNSIVIVNNLKEVTFIQVENLEGEIKKIIADSSEPITSSYKWTKLTYYNKEGKKLGEQNFNTIF